MDVFKASSVRTRERHLYRLSFLIIGNVTKFVGSVLLRSN